MIDTLNKTFCRSPLVSESHGVRDLSSNIQLKVMSRVAHYNIFPTTFQFTKILSGALLGI
jgi:hypothetical protein